MIATSLPRVCWPLAGLMSALLVTLCSELDRPWAELVVCTDASLSGMGVCEAKRNAMLVRRVRERSEKCRVRSTRSVRVPPPPSAGPWRHRGDHRPHDCLGCRSSHLGPMGLPPRTSRSSGRHLPRPELEGRQFGPLQIQGAGDNGCAPPRPLPEAAPCLTKRPRRMGSPMRVRLASSKMNRSSLADHAGERSDLSQTRSRCETRALGAATRKEYERHFGEFVCWAQSRPGKLPVRKSGFEELVLEYLGRARGSALHRHDVLYALPVRRSPAFLRPRSSSTRETTRALHALGGDDRAPGERPTGFAAPHEDRHIGRQGDLGLDAVARRRVWAAQGAAEARRGPLQRLSAPLDLPLPPGSWLASTCTTSASTSCVTEERAPIC